jgi:release factor glutamine methyltransferase
VISLNEAHFKGKAALNHLPDPERDARILLRFCLSLSDEEFFANPEKKVKTRQWKFYLRLLYKRSKSTPIAYLTGKKEFWSLPFLVRPGVFIPRPETELLVEKTLDLSQSQGKKIVDIGTGCGALAISLAREIPQAEVLATDISRRALRIARVNARRNGQNSITFLHGDLYKPLDKRALAKSCDFIISNPPYVAENEWKECSIEIRGQEPKQAIVSGVTGLEFIAALTEGAETYLKAGGYLLFEIGEGQKDKVVPFFDRRWMSVEVFKDLSGIPRVIAARLVE